VVVNTKIYFFFNVKIVVCNRTPTCSVTPGGRAKVRSLPGVLYCYSVRPCLCCISVHRDAKREGYSSAYSKIDFVRMVVLIYSLTELSPS
jgi:hypothetical protein